MVARDEAGDVVNASTVSAADAFSKYAHCTAIIRLAAL